MTAQPVEPDPGDLLWTVDGLAALVGSTVRTIRYYTTLGLLPHAKRRGRMVYYDERHRARLELIQTMQEQGLSLAAIEQHFAHLDPDAPASDLQMRRALIASWAPLPHRPAVQAELEQRAGRKLNERDLQTLQRLGTIREVDGLYEAGPTFEVGIELLDLDIPVASMEAAGEAISRHMDALVLELREILRTKVLAPLRAANDGAADSEQFAETMIQLRQLTLDALVGNFQQAAHRLADGSLLEREWSRP